MNFDGQIGDLGSKGSLIFYEVSYVGDGKEELRKYVLGECKRKGLEVVTMVDGEKDGKDMCTVRVRSGVGIV